MKLSVDKNLYPSRKADFAISKPAILTCSIAAVLLGWCNMRCGFARKPSTAGLPPVWWTPRMALKGLMEVSDDEAEAI